MVVKYQVFGRQVGSHVLAIGVLGIFFGGIGLSVSGSKKATEKGPPINAQSPDEEKFIQDFLKKAEGNGQKEAAKH